MNSDYERRRQGLTRALRNIWINWSFPLAAVVIVMMVSPHVSKTLMPVIIYALAGGIMILIRYNRKLDEHHVCYKIPYINTIILCWTATLMVVLNTLNLTHVLEDFHGQPYNTDMPYIPILILAPVGMLVALWFLKRGEKIAFCQDCEARTGQTVERGFLGKIYRQESDYQTKFMLIMWSILTVIEWGYYIYIYINVNLSITDRFFYIWMPTAVYGLTLVYMGIRYYGMWAYYMEHDPNNANDHEGFSRLRFLVICEDKIWLHIPDPEKEDITPDNILIDTPARTVIKFRTSVNTVEAGQWFNHITGIKNAEIKSLYVSSDKASLNNIFHFAAYLDTFDETVNATVTGEWFNLGKVQSLHQMKLISNLLEAELDRIHRIVMAWKTYSPDGQRLYKIRHYKPTFRLSDMRKWDVDYNDSRWLFVEMNNEDRPFFKLRKLWRKYISGIGN